MPSPLLDRLGEVEVAIGGLSNHGVIGALEQAAFIRVGLRCIADAIGELAAHVDELDREPGKPCQPRPPTVGPA